MPIREGHSSSVVMIAGRIINDCPGSRLIRIAVHLDNPEGVIDAVLAFVQKHKGPSGTRINKVTLLTIHAPVRTGPAAVLTTLGIKSKLAISADPVEHGHAANTRQHLSFDFDRALIGRTPPKPLGIAVRKKRALLDVLI